MIIQDNDLRFELLERVDLNSFQIARMFALMQANYESVSESMFLHDLNGKKWVGLVFDSFQKIQGFTTFAINPKSCGTSEYNIIFSGDTIINPVYWGTQILMKGWCYTVGQILASDLSKAWYWYLLSKGHRTYMYLPLFFHNYYPSMDQQEQEGKYLQIADEVSSILFQKYWQKDKGVIHFDVSHGELNTKLIEATFQKKNSPFVKFFLDKNPDFFKGDELVCIAPLFTKNLKRSAQAFVEFGMKCPLKVE